MSQDNIVDIMEELLRLYESEEESPTSDASESSSTGQPGSSYTSAIKFFGRPILPPLMTPRRREEMCMYKHQAVQVEAQVRAKVRQKLLARVQAVMKDIEERNAPSHAKSSCSPSTTSLALIGPPNPEEASASVHRSPGQAEAQNQSEPPHTLSPRAKEVEEAQGDVNIQSPRTNTKDSGVYSKGPAALDDDHNLSTEALNDTEHFMDEDRLDTMANITDISTEEEAEERIMGVEEDDDKSDSSETTTIEQVQQTVTKEESDKSDTDNHLSQESQTSEGDNEVFIETATEKSPRTEELVESDEQANTTSESCDEQLLTGKSEPAPTTTDLKDDMYTQTDQQVEQSQTSTQPFGSRERVEHLVKQLNSVLTQNILTVTQQSIPSTSSSATTLSSDEMNTTVIAYEEASVRSQLASDDTPVEGNQSTTDTESTATASDGDLSAIQDNSHITYRYSGLPLVDAHQCEVPGCVVSDELECTPDILRASLLSKVVLDTSEGTSDELSELDIGPKGRDSGMNLLLLDGTTPGSSASNTSDLSHISPLSNTKYTRDGQQCTADKSTTPPQTFDVSERISEQSKSSPSTGTATSASGSHKTMSPTPQSTAIVSGPFVKSADISCMYTESTELAPYMDTSNNTIDDSVLTLPYFEENCAGKTEGGTKQTAKSKATSSDKSSASAISKPAVASQTTPKGSVGSSSRQRHVRTSSYTLDHPSPVLVAAHERNNAENRGQLRDDIPSPSEITSSSRSSTKHTNTGPQHGFESAKLTSSMEDLKLKPVHRKLEYNVEHPKPILKKTSKAHPTAKDMSPPAITKSVNKSSPPAFPVSVSDEAGKEEHLHRYLEHLSQMPAYQQPLDSNPQSPLDSAQQAQPPHQGPQDPYSTDPTIMAGHSTDGSVNLEETLQLQMQYFETFKQQMMQQQQQQIAVLLAEQERQQLILQQEFLQQQRSITLHSSDSQQSALHHPHHGYAAARAYGAHEHQARQMSMDSSLLYEPYDRPYSAPTPRVSFAVGLETGSSKRSPAGVYCNQKFPISPNTSGMEAGLNSSQVETHEGSEGLYRSPAVLRQRSASGNHDESYIDESMTSNTAPAGRPRTQKKPPFFEHSPPSSSQVTYLQDLKHQDLPPKLQRGLEKMSAATKGFLTRKLLKTEKVQQIIKTIKDTAEFALTFQQDNFASKGGLSTLQDKNLLDRVLAQLTAAMYEIHEVFFELTTRERMELIHQSRLLEHERLFKRKTHESSQKSRRISAATRKALDRKKKAKAAEAIVFGQLRPKSCPPNTSSPKASRSSDIRAFKPVQTTLSPIKPDKISASSLLHSIGGRKPLSPRKTGMSAVKRIQNKARPASAATRQIARKPNMVPATRKIGKSTTSADGDAIGKRKRPSPKVGDKNRQPQSHLSATHPHNNHREHSPLDINSNPVPTRSTCQGSNPQPKSAASDHDNHGLPTLPVNQGSNPRPRAQVSTHSTMPGSQPTVAKKTSQPKLVRHTSHAKHSVVSPNIRANGVTTTVGGTRPLS